MIAEAWPCKSTSAIALAAGARTSLALAAAGPSSSLDYLSKRDAQVVAGMSDVLEETLAKFENEPATAALLTSLFHVRRALRRPER